MGPRLASAAFPHCPFPGVRLQFLQLVISGVAQGCIYGLIALADGRRPLLVEKTPPVIVVRGRTVILMWLLAPVFGTLAWLLWRDGHGIWAGLATVQLLLAANASVAYLRQQLR